MAILRAAVEVMGEDGYEGASIRDMAARAGVSVAALYYHFPSKLDLLLEFLDEAYDVTLSRIDRRLLAAGPDPEVRLDEIVGTLIAAQLHDPFAQLAANVASREYTRLKPPDRSAIDQKRRRIRRRIEDVIEEGVEQGGFHNAEVQEAARAIYILATSLVEPYKEMRCSMAEVIVLYQGFARAIAGAPPREAGRGSGRRAARRAVTGKNTRR